MCVDILRSYQPAAAWLQSVQGQLGLSPVVWLEVLDGARDAQAQREALKLLRRFVRVEQVAEDFDWAIESSLRFRLSHGVDMMDCLIASASYRLKLTLFTANLKHFKPLLGSLADKPY